MTQIDSTISQKYVFIPAAGYQRNESKHVFWGGILRVNTYAQTSTENNMYAM